MAAVCLPGLLGQSVLTAEDEPANLVENGSFENDPVGQLSSKLPASWAKPYVDPSVLEIVEEPRPGSVGDKSLKIGTNQANKRSGVMSGLIPLDPRIPLEVFLWLKDGGDMKIKRQPYVGIAWYDAQRTPIIREPGTKVNYIYLNFRKQADWQLITRVVIPFHKDEKDGTKRYYSIPSKAAFFELRIFVENYPWPVWVDDVQVIQTKPAAKAMPATGQK